MKKPKPTRLETLQSPGEMILAILKDERQKLRTRWGHAKRCYRNGEFVEEDIAIAQQVLKSRLSAYEKSLALRMLHDHEKKARSGKAVTVQAEADVMRLPQSWRDRIGDVAGPVEWIPDAEWQKLASYNRADRKKVWLPRGFTVVTPTIEEGDEE